ncbi:MAG: transcriptional repressor [Bacteroidales bacterium]|nr:transcriptional repressor [Bacteroidales bacterium]
MVQKDKLLDDELFEEYKQVFYSYLEKKGLNRTAERFAILKEVYLTDGHFNVELLDKQLIRKKYHISRATFYHTLDLLQDCHLVQKHQFDNGAAVYERIYDTRPHDHLLLTDGRVIEFSDSRIEEIVASLEAQYGVRVIHRSVTLYAKPLKDKDDSSDSR